MIDKPPWKGSKKMRDHAQSLLIADTINIVQYCRGAVTQPAMHIDGENTRWLDVGSWEAAGADLPGTLAKGSKR